jgi:hypothetical protein
MSVDYAVLGLTRNQTKPTRGKNTGKLKPLAREALALALHNSTLQPKDHV